MSDQKSGIEAVFATGPCRRADCKSEGSHGFGGFCSAYCRSNPEAAGEKPVHDVAVCQNRMGCSNRHRQDRCSALMAARWETTSSPGTAENPQMTSHLR